MINENEDALICDLAEYYHVLDYRSLPPRMVATLVSGLRDDSRLYMRVNDAKASAKDTLLAIVADRIGQVLEVLTGSEVPRVTDVLFGIEPDSPLYGYDSGEDFMAAWREIAEK